MGLCFEGGGCPGPTSMPCWSGSSGKLSGYATDIRFPVSNFYYLAEPVFAKRPARDKGPVHDKAPFQDIGEQYAQYSDYGCVHDQPGVWGDG